MKKNFTRFTGAFALLFLCLNVCAQTKDYEGADKWQHAGLGFASAGLCAVIDNKPGSFNGRCFAISELVGATEQIYAIRTNPAKLTREGAYDFLAHSIGAAISTFTVQRTLVQISHEHGQTSMRLTWNY